MILAAPGGKMNAEFQDTATDIEVRIARARLSNERPGPPLPDPLADPLQDIRINAATAQAYFVKVGEFIQVIDVSGRQMTDFQCFSARKLDKGVENALDATVTRTLTAGSYPTPGLPSKASDSTSNLWSRSFRTRSGGMMRSRPPAIHAIMTMSAIRACELHRQFQCSLDPYGIARRRGWEAINFFYNTSIDAQNQVIFDESWSRPGDYVLMRALTDLVCVSSACPDDIDPGNGWNPTDIHVRTYSDKQKFSRAVAFRMTPDADPQMTRETAFHPCFSALTRNYTEYRCFWLPTRLQQCQCDR